MGEARKAKDRPVAPHNDEPSSSGGSKPPSRRDLSSFPSFPVEIQLEVYKHVSPRDLYNLSRASKSFRAFFWHGSNASLWVASFANTEGMPERPSWIPLPSFVRLLYSPTCKLCEERDAHEVAWVWFERYCNRCLWKVANAARIAYYNMGLFDEVTRGPQLRWVRAFNVYNARHPEADGVEKLILKKDEARFKKELAELAERNRGKSEWVRRQQSEKFYTDTLAKAQKRKEFAKRWEDFMEMDREKIRISRIIDKVKEDGWEAEITFLGEQGIREMCRIQALSNSTETTVWETIPLEVSTLLEDTRKARSQHERHPMFRPRFIELDGAVTALCTPLLRGPETYAVPLFVDFALTPSCRALVQSPPSTPITRDDFTAIIPDLESEWMAARRSELTALVLPRLEKQTAEDMDPLGLAMGFFCCTGPCHGGRRLLYWPEVLVHVCARRVTREDADSSYGADAYARAAVGFKANPTRSGPTWDTDAWAGARAPFSAECFSNKKANAKAADVVRKIIVATGQDPASATVEDMKRSHVRLWCGTCQKKGKGSEMAKFAYGWEAAFAHASERMMRGSWGGHQSWVAVSEERSNDVVRLEHSQLAMQTSLTTGPGFVWSCRVCLNWDGQWDAMRFHLAKEHQIVNPQPDGQDVAYVNTSMSRFDGPAKLFYAPPIDCRGLEEDSN